MQKKCLYAIKFDFFAVFYKMLFLHYVCSLIPVHLLVNNSFLTIGGPVSKIIKKQFIFNLETLQTLRNWIQVVYETVERL